MLPLIVPIISSALIDLAYTVFHRLVSSPTLYVSFVCGLKVCDLIVPVISAAPPTKIFLATAIPPAVIILPVDKFVVSATLVILIAPVNPKLPSTSSASSGAARLLLLLMLLLGSYRQLQ